MRTLTNPLRLLTRGMASYATSIETGIPPVIHKPVLTVPGANPESKVLLESLLEKDRQVHHCFWGRVGFHNHLSHHLLAAYDLGAPPALLQSIYDAEVVGLSPVFSKGRKDAPIERLDVKFDRDNWKQYVGQDKFYANFVEFFAAEIKQTGAAATLEHFIFSAETNNDGGLMIERFVGGALHPMIQMGYAIEFQSDAMVAQALAQCAVHDAFEPSLFPWNPAPSSTEPTSTDFQPSPHPSTTRTNGTAGIIAHPNPNFSSTGPRLPSSGHSLLSILREIYASDILTPVLPYDPDAILSQRRKDALTPRRIKEIRRMYGIWHPALTTDAFSDSSSSSAVLSESELKDMLEQLAFFATLLFAGTSKPNRKPRLDFFLMHILTSSLFVEPLMGVLKEGRSRRMLLAAYLPVAVAYMLTRGRPRVGCEVIMGYEACPLPMSKRSNSNEKVNGAPEAQEGAKLPGALGNPTKREYMNAWVRMLPHVLPAKDSHTLKAWRSLYVYAQRFGSVPPGGVIGAFCTKTGGEDRLGGDKGWEESLPGASKLDGSVFVRAAGVLVDTMGWVGPMDIGGGDEEGSWDRSGLGWDGAWQGED